MMNWLKNQNLKRWIGDAALAAAILVLASLFTGVFDIFADIENGVQVAGFFGLAVWFGLPFIGSLIPAKFADYVSIVSPDSPPTGTLLFGLSAPVVVLLTFSFLVW